MEDKEIKEKDIVNSDLDNIIDNTNNKSKKKVVYIIFGIIVFILLCIIIFCNYYNSLTFRSNSNNSNNNYTDGTNTNVDRDKDEQNEQDKQDEQEVANNNDTSVKNEQDEPVDLAKCTFEYSMSDYSDLKNKSRYGETCYKTYKYIINDVVVDGKKLNVEILDGQAGVIPESDSGLYINGTKVESLYSGYSLDVDGFSVHNNMLFAHIDGGTYIRGKTDYLVFDKNGNKIYDLDDALSKIKLVDPNANPNDKNSTYVLTRNIHRSSTKVVDGMLVFTTITYDGETPENKIKGSNFYIPFTEGKFEDPIYVGGHKSGEDFLSKKIS